MNYNNGKIYRIINPNNTKYYIGSTVNELDKRFKQHLSSKKRHDKAIEKAKTNPAQKIPSKLASFDLLEGGSIELIENYPCKNKRELHRREGEFIRNHKENITNYFVANVSLHDFFKAYHVLKKLKMGVK